MKIKVIRVERIIVDVLQEKEIELDEFLKTYNDEVEDGFQDDAIHTATANAVSMSDSFITDIELEERVPFKPFEGVDFHSESIYIEYNGDRYLVANTEIRNAMKDDYYTSITNPDKLFKQIKRDNKIDSINE